jgi:hypothetical protein
MAIRIKGRLGSCNWGKEIIGTLNKSISASRFRSHIISRVTSEAITYSASHIDSATIGYLLNPQTMGILTPRNRYPLVNLQVDVSPAQSESV